MYFWAAAYVKASLEDTAQCLLVIIGATPEGKKELVGLIDGVRESAQSWKEFLLHLKRRGLAIGPKLAVADGVLGFWQAIEEVWPKTVGQRCWVHKTANVLNNLPTSQQSKTNARCRRSGWPRPRRMRSRRSILFVETWAVKYDKRRVSDQGSRRAARLYDFPASTETSAHEASRPSSLRHRCGIEYPGLTSPHGSRRPAESCSTANWPSLSNIMANHLPGVRLKGLTTSL